MSDKKNQHYIPQFCLRKFASDSNKVINLYNLDSKKFIKNASIKHQACKNYFYGKDIAIENALAYFEDGVSKIFNKILRDSKLPQKKSEDYLMLLFFISIQHNRTKFAHDDMMGIHHQIMSILGKNFNHLSTLSENNWIYEKMSIAVKCISYLKDLKMKLIVNKTTNEFIYSDNPIVFYNQFLEMKGRPEIGCNSVGIEILLPISPFLYLILYDAQIYHIGKSQSDTIETYDNDDIDNLNRLQILSANSNIYFSKDSTQQYIEKIAENKSNYRRKNMSTVTEYHSVTNKYKSLIGIQAIPIACKLKLSFMKLTKKAKRYDYDSNKVIHYRLKK